MTVSHFGLSATLTTMLSLSSLVLGTASISCTSQGISFSSGEFTSFIPGHIAQYDVGDGLGPCYGQEIVGDCVEAINTSDGPQSFHCDNGEWVSATFWITKDQCLNIEVDGQHHYRCGETLTTDCAAGCSL